MCRHGGGVKEREAAASAQDTRLGGLPLGQEGGVVVFRVRNPYRQGVA